MFPCLIYTIIQLEIVGGHYLNDMIFGMLAAITLNYILRRLNYIMNLRILDFYCKITNNLFKKEGNILELEKDLETN